MNMGFLTKHERWLIFSLLGIMAFGVPLAGLLKRSPVFFRRISFLEAVSAPPVHDLNAVTFEKLLTVPGVGRLTAEKIIRYRMARGDFDNVEDLNNVPGLNAKVITRIVPYLTVEKEARHD